MSDYPTGSTADRGLASLSQRNPLNDQPTLVIDANVFMGAGTDPFKFYHNCDIVIPYAVIDTLDEHRGDGSGIGWACRLVLDYIERLRVNHGAGRLSSGGVVDHNGNTVRIVESSPNDRPTTHRPGDGRASTAVISVAQELRRSADRVTVVSNSLLTRLRANDCSIDATAYNDGSLQPFDGWFDIDDVDLDSLDGTQLDLLKPANDWSGDLTNELLAWLDRYITDHGATTPSNMAVRINYASDTQQIVLKRGDHFVDPDYQIHAGNIYPRRGNNDQMVALTYLMDPDIQVVSLGGVAGSGKSILALAAGMAQVSSNRYERVMVFRSMVEVAQQEIGFLPGDLDAKMAPWAQAIWDNVDQIDRKNGKVKAPKHAATCQHDQDNRKLRRNPYNSTTAPNDATTELQDAQQRHLEDISVQPVTYLRGRTFVNTFVIVDDAQSLDRTTLLDIISRLGRGSKIVFTYDMTQQDNPYISNSTSILSVVNNLLSEDVFAHIDFTKSERSRLAQLAADLLAKEA